MVTVYVGKAGRPEQCACCPAACDACTSQPLVGTARHPRPSIVMPAVHATNAMVTTLRDIRRTLRFTPAVYSLRMGDATVLSPVITPTTCNRSLVFPHRLAFAVLGANSPNARITILRVTDRGRRPCPPPERQVLHQALRVVFMHGRTRSLLHRRLRRNNGCHRAGTQELVLRNIPHAGDFVSGARGREGTEECGVERLGYAVNVVYIVSVHARDTMRQDQADEASDVIGGQGRTEGVSNGLLSARVVSVRGSLSQVHTLCRCAVRCLQATQHTTEAAH